MHLEKGVWENRLKEKQMECRSHRRTSFSLCTGDAEMARGFMLAGVWYLCECEVISRKCK